MKLKHVSPVKKRNRIDDPTKRSQFDFKLLNRTFSERYESFKADDTEHNRVAFYQAIYELSLACLKVSAYRRNPERDLEIIATEFAFTQLNRVLDGTFKPEPRVKGTLFPADKYFSLTLQRPANQHFTRDLPKKSWSRLHIFIEDLELFLEDNAGRISEENQYGERAMDVATTNREYARDLFRALRLLYTEEEIRRLLPLATEMLFVSNATKLRDPETPAPRDLRVFMDVLIVCAQRLAATHRIDTDVNLPKKDVNRMLETALRSTLFLSAASQYDRVPRDLLLALDHRSLYRLAYILGGSTIRIPTVRELGILQNAISAAVAVYLAPEAERKKKLEDVKQYDAVFAKQRGKTITTMELVSKIVDANRIVRDDNSSTQPLINVILSSLKVLEAMVGKLHRSSISPSETLNQYVALSKSLSDIVDRIIALEAENK